MKPPERPALLVTMSNPLWAVPARSSQNRDTLTRGRRQQWSPWTTPLTVAEEQPHNDKLRFTQPTTFSLTAPKSVAFMEECKNKVNIWWFFSSTASSELSQLMSQLPKHPMDTSSNAKFFIIWKKTRNKILFFSYVAPHYFLCAS